jgi:hypothetical protein
VRNLVAAAFVVLVAGTAQAGIPTLNYTCPGDFQLHADEGGPVYVNGKEAKLKKVNDNYFEARRFETTFSIAVNPDGSATVTYTGKHGANGVCQPSSAAAPSTSKSETAVAEKACLAAVAKKVNVDRSKLEVADVMTAESGIGVMVNVPGATAPWSCLSDAKGHVQGVTFTGTDGD